MAKHRRSTLAISAKQARQALAVLVQEGKLKAAEVRQALQRRDRLIRELSARLTALGQGVGRVARQFRESPIPLAQRAGAGRSRKRRKPKLSAATRKLYQQQGRYMAAVRNLKKAQRAKVKAIREKSGVRAAIAAAKAAIAEGGR